MIQEPVVLHNEGKATLRSHNRCQRIRYKHILLISLKSQEKQGQYQLKKKMEDSTTQKSSILISHFTGAAEQKGEQTRVVQNKKNCLALPLRHKSN